MGEEGHSNRVAQSEAQGLEGLFQTLPGVV